MAVTDMLPTSHMLATASLCMPCLCAVPCNMWQDFPTEEARHAFRQRCTTTVTANCLQGAR
jgi:hypothetical protein